MVGGVAAVDNFVVQHFPPPFAPRVDHGSAHGRDIRINIGDDGRSPLLWCSGVIVCVRHPAMLGPVPNVFGHIIACSGFIRGPYREHRVLSY